MRLNALPTPAAIQLAWVIMASSISNMAPVSFFWNRPVITPELHILSSYVALYLIKRLIRAHFKENFGLHRWAGLFNYPKDGERWRKSAKDDERWLMTAMECFRTKGCVVIILISYVVPTRFWRPQTTYFKLGVLHLLQIPWSIDWACRCICRTCCDAEQRLWCLYVIWHCDAQVFLAFHFIYWLAIHSTTVPNAAFAIMQDFTFRNVKLYLPSIVVFRRLSSVFCRLWLIERTPRPITIVRPIAT